MGALEQVGVKSGAQFEQAPRKYRADCIRLGKDKITGIIKRRERSPGKASVLNLVQLPSQGEGKQKPNAGVGTGGLPSEARRTPDLSLPRRGGSRKNKLGC